MPLRQITTTTPPVALYAYAKRLLCEKKYKKAFEHFDKALKASGFLKAPEDQNLLA